MMVSQVSVGARWHFPQFPASGRPIVTRLEAMYSEAVRARGGPRTGRRGILP